MQRDNRMRIIGDSLDVGYRDDLNFNFGLISTLVAGSSSENEKLKEELDAAIKNLQTQINLLAGENIDELIARVNDSAQQALEAAQNARIATNSTEEATNLANVATSLANASAVLANEKANYADEKAVLAQKAADNANLEASNLGQLKVDVVQATQNANVATTNANEATSKSIVATNAINAVLPNVNGLENKTSWMVSISYKKNNFVTFNGNGYMALRDNVGVTPPLPPSTSNDDWSLYTLRGEKGEQGTGVSILGSLNSVDDLPIKGSQGDGYLINKEINGEKVAELYVWSETTLSWENVGNIKGPKGDTGDQGPKGEAGLPGKDADLTEVNANILTLRQDYDEVKKEVTEHLVEYEKLENRVTVLEEGSNTTIADVAGLNREVAYLKLKQEAGERIEGGTVFADDMNGQRFGFTFNADDSKGIKIQDGKMLMLDEDKTNYDIKGSTVVAQPYSTAGNSGRKITMLENGWLVAVLWNATTKQYPFYVSKDNGLTWAEVTVIGNSGSDVGFCAITSFRNTVAIAVANSSSVSVYAYNLVTNSYTNTALVDNGQSAMSGVSIAVDKKTGHLHATWSSKNSTYASSFNIRYSKSTDSGKTWSSTLQVTTDNVTRNDNTNAVISVLPNGNPQIVAQYTAPAANRIYSYTWDGSKFNNPSTVYDGASNVQSNPTAVVDKDGTIHVAWEGGLGNAGGPTSAICYSKSTNGGVSWSNVEILTPQAFRGNASIAVDIDNKVVIVYRSYDGKFNQVSKITNTVGSWGVEESLTALTTGSNLIAYPSAVGNNTLRFDTPPFIYNDHSTDTIKFMSKWSAVVETPTTEATAVYDVPSTNYVGAFVQKIGNVTVSAKINDTVMVSELENNEYEFTGSIPDVVPVKLSLYLKRESVANGENDAITRILGGRS